MSRQRFLTSLASCSFVLVVAMAVVLTLFGCPSEDADDDSSGYSEHDDDQNGDDDSVGDDDFEGDDDASLDDDDSIHDLFEGPSNGYIIYEEVDDEFDYSAKLLSYDGIDLRFFDLSNVDYKTFQIGRIDYSTYNSAMLIGKETYGNVFIQEKDEGYWSKPFSVAGSEDLFPSAIKSLGNGFARMIMVKYSNGDAIGIDHYIWSQDGEEKLDSIYYVDGNIWLTQVLSVEENMAFITVEHTLLEGSEKRRDLFKLDENGMFTDIGYPNQIGAEQFGWYVNNSDKLVAPHVECNKGKVEIDYYVFDEEQDSWGIQETLIADDLQGVCPEVLKTMNVGLNDDYVIFKQKIDTYHEEISLYYWDAGGASEKVQCDGMMQNEKNYVSTYLGDASRSNGGIVFIAAVVERFENNGEKETWYVINEVKQGICRKIEMPSGVGEKYKLKNMDFETNSSNSATW